MEERKKPEIINELTWNKILKVEEKAKEGYSLDDMLLKKGGKIFSQGKEKRDEWIKKYSPYLAQEIKDLLNIKEYAKTEIVEEIEINEPKNTEIMNIIDIKNLSINQKMSFLIENTEILYELIKERKELKENIQEGKPELKVSDEILSLNDNKITSLRVSPQVLEKFFKLADEYKAYSKINLLNFALNEIAEKYSKDYDKKYNTDKKQ